MGFVPPPPPSTQKMLTERRAAGAKTWRELDPNLARWADRQGRMHRFQAACLAAGALGLLVIVAMVMLRNFATS